MTIAIQPATTAAALKAERERDKAQALQDYENEQRARQANMAQLRVLRLAKEDADPKKAAAPRRAKKKATTRTGNRPRALS